MVWYIGDFVVPERAHGLVFLGFFFTTLGAIAVGMRMFSRAVLIRSVGIDDGLMCVALVGTIAYLTASTLQIKFGLGDAVRLDQLESFLQALYATVVAYSFTQLTIKFSILFQYRRIFQTPKAEKVVTGLMIWLSLYSAFCLGSSIITCWPIAKYWDDSIPGGCIDRSNLHYALAGFNIANDLVLLVFPMPMLRSLHVTFRAKLVLIGVFACGAFACIVGMIRLQSLYVNNSAPINEQPIFGVNIAIWSGLEINIAVICASVPALKALFIKIIPKLDYSSGPSANSRPLHSFDKRSGTRQRTPLDKLGIRVHQTFEMKTMQVKDSDSEKNLVATSWVPDSSITQTAVVGQR